MSNAKDVFTFTDLRSELDVLSNSWLLGCFRTLQSTYSSMTVLLCALTSSHKFPLCSSALHSSKRTFSCLNKLKTLHSRLERILHLKNRSCRYYSQLHPPNIIPNVNVRLHAIPPPTRIHPSIHPTLSNHYKTVNESTRNLHDTHHFCYRWM